MEFIRVDSQPSRDLFRLWFLDKYGQPRFLEIDRSLSDEKLGMEIVRQIREVMGGRE